MINKLKCLKFAVAALSASLCLTTVISSGITSDTLSYGISADAAEKFVPRLTEPSTSSKYYTTDNPFYQAGYGMPNCTCYAWGRAYELLGKKPNLCEGNADDWYDYNINGKYYSYGQTPKLGAIACWSGQHVAVVEEINGDTLTLSHSSWGGPYFYTGKINKNNMENIIDGFQGYIYIGNWETEDDRPKGKAVTESEAAGETVPDGDYWLGSRLQTGYFMDPESGTASKASEGAKVQMYNYSSCAPNSQDTWTLEYLNNGFYKIKQLGTDMCLSVDGNSVYTDAAIKMTASKSNATGQQWSIERNDKGGYNIRSRCNGGYLDVKGSSKTSGTLLQTATTNKSLSQAWNFVPYAGAVFKGKGTESDPFQISSAKDLRALAALVNDDVSAPSYYSKYYIQTEDIDLNGANFTPIGTRYMNNTGMGFDGVYNGNKHSIKGLYVDREGDYNGLFGWSHSGIITDLNVYGEIDCPDSARTGGIIGSIGSPDAKYIKNCSFTGTVKGKFYVGGITGELWASGMIRSCYFNGEVTEVSGNGYSGGIAGFVSHGWEDNTYDITVRNCYAAGSSQNLSGGIIGCFETITPGTVTIKDNFYLSSMALKGIKGDYTEGCQPLGSSALKTSYKLLGDPYIYNDDLLFNDGYPIFEWQTKDIDTIGDIDGDGIVDENDMVLMKNWLLNIKDSDVSTDLDINGDGKVNVIDHIILRRLVANKQESHKELATK